MTKTTTAKFSNKTIYRECSCGEDAHDLTCKKTDEGWISFWACRNCRSEIHPKVQTPKQYV